MANKTIADILGPLGYQIQYVTGEKYLGSEPATLTVATKDGVNYFAFKICAPDHPDHHRRIQSIQDPTPRMAKIVGPFEDVVLSSEVPGQNLWNMDVPPDPQIVEAQLREFALWTSCHQLIHGDLRPWNVIIDPLHGVKVIDWRDLSAFVDDLEPMHGLPPRRCDLLGQGHYGSFHPGLVAQKKFLEIDESDVHLIGKLLRGEIGLSEAWRKPHPSNLPSWCKP